MSSVWIGNSEDLEQPLQILRILRGHDAPAKPPSDRCRNYVRSGITKPPMKIPNRHSRPSEFAPQAPVPCFDDIGGHGEGPRPLDFREHHLINGSLLVAIH